MLLKAMPQKSKLLRSRDEWKCKAVQRSYEIREHRKAQKRYQDKITALKVHIEAMERVHVAKKNDPASH